MAHAETMSGAGPLLARDPAPSRQQATHLPVPTAGSFRRVRDTAIEDPVSPPREGRQTDLTKTSVPLPFMLTIVAAAIAVAMGVWRIESQVSILTTKIEYERQLDAERSKALDQRFEALESKIEAAGLRNTAMAAYSQLSTEQTKPRK